MDIPNQDIKTINQIAITQKLTEIAKSNRRLIYSQPGISPLRPPKNRQRSLYNLIQLNEAVALAAVVGVKMAASKSGVKSSSIYKHAAAMSRPLGYVSGYKRPSRRRKYTPEALREAFGRALQWQRNTGVGLRICVRRAAKEAQINENYLWSLYCTKDPVLQLGEPTQ